MQGPTIPYSLSRADHFEEPFLFVERISSCKLQHFFKRRCFRRVAVFPQSSCLTGSQEDPHSTRENSVTIDHKFYPERAERSGFETLPECVDLHHVS